MTDDQVKDEQKAEPAFLLNGYVAMQAERPAAQLKYGDVVKVTFSGREARLFPNAGPNPRSTVDRLLLVIHADEKASGDFYGLILPADHRLIAPNSDQIVKYPNVCAVKLEIGDEVKDVFIALYDRTFPKVNDEQLQRAISTP